MFLLLKSRVDYQHIANHQGVMDTIALFFLSVVKLKDRGLRGLQFRARTTGLAGAAVANNYFATYGYSLLSIWIT
jgi:hypothetical protein